MILAATSSVRFSRIRLRSIVALVVFAVLDLLAVLVGLAGLRAPAVEVLVEADPHDLVGREEAVVDALPEGVGVDGLAEVVDVGDVLGFLRRGGEADLGGRREVFENLAPGGIFGGAAAMALVDDDQIEEVRRELLVDVLLFLGAGDGLVEAEVDLVGLVDRAVGDLGHRLTEGLEVVGLGLVGQDVAVDQEEDAFLGAGLPQPPDDLEGGVGLAGAGGHDQQDAVLAPGDGLDGAVDGDELVVAGRLAGAVVVVVLSGDGLPVRGYSPCRAVALPRVRRAWELVEGDLACHGAAGRRCGRVPERRRRWSCRRREGRAFPRSPAPAACRRRRRGCCPWPRRRRAGYWACREDVVGSSWPRHASPSSRER